MKYSIRDLATKGARLHALASAFIAIWMIAIFVPRLRGVRFVKGEVGCFFELPNSSAPAP